MKISIDKDVCIGCGMCESICDKCFKLNGDKAQVVDENGCSDCNLDEAVENCPVDAIKVEK